jgi:hypothetical protein
LHDKNVLELDTQNPQQEDYDFEDENSMDVG